MEEILLKVEHVSKNFGATKALEDVSFTIKRGPYIPCLEGMEPENPRLSTS